MKLEWHYLILVPIPRVWLAFDRKRQLRAAVIDRCDEVRRRPEAERAMADGFDLVVHSLHGAVGDALLGPGQDSIEVGAKHAYEFLEGLQARTHGRAHPFLQMVFRPLGLVVFPEQLKGFFEVIGAYDGRVPTDQGRKALFLLAGEIPWILQQQPAAAF